MRERTKKVAAIIVLFAILLTQTAVCSAFEDIKDADLAQAVNTLVDFGIISGYTDGTFRPDNHVTRSEFCKLIVCTALYQYTDAHGNFGDVSYNHWAKNYIYIAERLNIVNGTSPGLTITDSSSRYELRDDGTYYDVTAPKFSPDDNITYEQAIKMVAVALGYEAEAQAAGGYPDGYHKVDADLGITKGIDFKPLDYATRGDIALMLTNALHIPFRFQRRFEDPITPENGITLFELHTRLKAHSANRPEGGTVYTHSSGDFSITIPARWEGLYHIKEYDDTHFIDIIHTKNETSGGELIEFGFASLFGESYYYGVDIPGLGLYELDGWICTPFYCYPYSAEFDCENTEAVAEYLMMQSDLAEVIASFTISDTLTDVSYRYAPDYMPEPEPELDGILYTNTAFDFTLLLPKSWEGLYEAREAAFGVGFYNVANAATDWGGHLFTVSAHEEPIDYPGYWEIARADGLIFYASVPTDIQYDYENADLAQSYRTMEEDVYTILDTFQLN